MLASWLVYGVALVGSYIPHLRAVCVKDRRAVSGRAEYGRSRMREGVLDPQGGSSPKGGHFYSTTRQYLGPGRASQSVVSGSSGITVSPPRRPGRL